MKFRALIAFTALFLSLFIATPSDARNRATDIFSSTSVSQITIALSSQNAAKIAKAPKVGVPATFSITNDEGSLDYSNLPIKFHLKGSSTLEQNPSLTSSRPSLRVKFHQDGVIKLPFLGSLKSLTLNSMSQDSSRIHEYTAYRLYNAMNIPAPRVGYATINVVIGGRVYNKGLFAIIEPYDDVFLSQHYDNHTQHLYEPCKYWTDVTRGDISKGGASCTNSLFQVKEGWKHTPNKLDLRALSSIQKISNKKLWWQAMGRYTDRAEMIRKWAVDNFISAWDSYSGSIVNNYYLRSDSLGVFTMLPTGPDETFEYNYKMDATSIGYPRIYSDFGIKSMGRGAMFTKCLNYRPCLNEYLDDLKLAKEAAKTSDINGQIDQIASTLKGLAPSWAAASVKNWIAMKGTDVDALLTKYGR